MSGVMGDRLVVVEWLLQRSLLESHNIEAYAETAEHVPLPVPLLEARPACQYLPPVCRLMPVSA